MIYRLIAYTLILLGLVGTFYMGLTGINDAEHEVPAISRTSLSRQLADSSRLIFIDVSTAAEIDTNSVPWEPLLRIPLLDLEKRCPELTPYAADQMVVLCPTGNRSRQGARILRKAGFKAFYLEDGLGDRP